MRAEPEQKDSPSHEPWIPRRLAVVFCREYNSNHKHPQIFVEYKDLLGFAPLVSKYKQPHSEMNNCLKKHTLIMF